MLRRLFLTISLALLFGLGQQGVAVHAISHLADEQRESQHDQKSHHLSFCDKCVVYAELAGAVGAGSPFLPAADVRHVLVDHRRYAAASFALHPYSARAPPAHS